MRLLVTGGAGFLGSNLCNRLLNGGHSVICVDNLHTGSKGNLAACLNNPRFEFIAHDVQDPIRVDVDAIYHLACPASPVHYQADPIRTMKTCFHGTLNMLELGKKLRIPLLLASTSEVYGDAVVHPQTEDYWGNVNPVGIRSCYDEGKRAAESLATDFRRCHAVDTRIIRIFNTYGPGMHPHDGRVVSNFIVQALENQPLTIYGDGTQSRSFCYVDDLINGIVQVMEMDRCPGPINLGNPDEFTVGELAEKVLTLTGSSAGIVTKPLPQDDPVRRKPNITKARDFLGWQPQVMLDEGLVRTVEYFRALVQGQAHAR